MPRFLHVRIEALKPERLRILQEVYDWLEDVVTNRAELAEVLLHVPDKCVTYEQVLYYVGERLGWTRGQGTER